MAWRGGGDSRLCKKVPQDYIECCSISIVTDSVMRIPGGWQGVDWQSF